MILYTKKKAPSSVVTPSSHTKALLNAKGSWSGTLVEFDVPRNIQVDGFTTEEIAALRKSHKTSTPNFVRALEVKRLIIQGKSRAQIISLLKHRGSGFQSRVVSADYAALSKQKGKVRNLRAK